MFTEKDLSLLEINPLVLSGDAVIPLDCKLNFDSSALYRHPEIAELRDADEEDPLESEAAQYDLSWVSLDGNIGCMVNGAGLAMATMDIIQVEGGEPANFLDLGDMVAEGIVAAARELGVKVPLVVRLDGTNSDRAKEILAESGLDMLPADGMKDAAEKIVAAVNA